MTLVRRTEGAQPEPQALGNSLQIIESPPWRRVEGTIIATARSVRQTYDRALAHLEVTLPEASLLTYVTEYGPLTQTQIAKALDAGRAATGLRIDTLERRGMVERNPHASDRRVWLITATDNGRDLAARINRIDEHFRVALRAGLTTDDRHHLITMLLQIQENLRTIDVGMDPT